MTSYPIRKRYQHTHMFDEILVTGDMTVEGTFTFGDASFDTFILKGRMSTMTAAGSAIDIGSTYTYGEGIELRWQVTDWTGKTTFNGMYIRSEAITTAATAKSIRGMELYGVCNNVTQTTGSLWGALIYAYNKGVSAVTINNMYAVQAELTWDASRTGDCTITTEAAVILAKVTGGRVADYTKIHGMILRFGEMDGDSQTFGSGIQIEDDGDMSGTSTLTNGLNIAIGTTYAVKVTGNCTSALYLEGTPTGDVIDFSGVTWVPNVSGSSGNCLIRAGSYGTPIANDSEYQSGMIRLYGRTTDLNASYDRGIFVGLKTQGSKGIYPVAGLAEVENTASGNGPTSVHACQFIAHLLQTGAKIASTATMYGGWFKVAAVSGSTIPVGAIVAPLWVDNQLYGSNIGSGGFLATEYGIYATTGGSQPRAFVGFSTTSSGYVNFLSFDSTIASQSMIGTATISGGTQDKYLKIDMNGTAYGIALYAI